MVEIPSFSDFMNPIIEALHALGGSGTNNEINNEVVELMGLSDEQTEILHNPDRGGRSEVEYRLAWARTYLKKYGVIENSSRGVWSLTVDGRNVFEIDPQEVMRYVRQQSQNSGAAVLQDTTETEIDETSDDQTWREALLSTLLAMEPAAFERLTKLVLRESGFIQVEVTGRSGDGGIDGKGIVRLSGLLSFHVLFQCKRYQGSVSPAQVRDFRGALTGRADKGLLITTGTFTKSAIEEATRDGATPIDLIDGDQLVDKLKELSLGVKTELVEQVTIDHEWLLGI
jgi:restriction system protein